MQAANEITLFSNGIGHFRRTYQIPAGKTTKITIPFRNEYIGDVAASLQVFGKVRLDSPPSFTPANAIETALDLRPNTPGYALFTGLSGARVRIAIFGGRSKEVTLIGREEKECEQGKKQNVVYVLEDGGKVSWILVEQIENVEFLEDHVRAEIDKALRKNIQKIKPDSTLLELAISAITDDQKEPVTAIVQYTLPVAAWKMRYEIRGEKGAYVLGGAAIVDNNTDEDWNDFQVSVVTGNPISFNTDIATVVVPSRKFVQLVEGSTLGNVEVPEALGAVMPSGLTRGSSRLCARTMKSSIANRADFGLAPAAYAGEECDSELYVAESAGVDAKDVGDFCVFTHRQPITILSRKSAVVPMFSVTLNQAGVLLYYREANHARRPFRAVKFRNETAYSLGKGKTVIYQDEVFSGECVLEATKPGENRMLPHCLENGCKIVKDSKRIKNRVSSVKISDGAAVQEMVQTTSTVYSVENKKDEVFKVALEHNLVFREGDVKITGVEIVEQEKTPDGWRIYFELQPKQSLEIKVAETLVESQEVRLGHDSGWIRTIVASVKGLDEDPGVKKCIDLQSEIDNLDRQISDEASKVAQLEKQSDRVRKNLDAVKERIPDTAEWVQDLGNTEKAIREIEETKLPDLRFKKDHLRAKLSQALRELTVTWKS